MVLHPVVMSIPTAERSAPGKERVQRLSRLSRVALRLSAAKSGFELHPLQKDDDDVPVASSGIYWSVSHKPGCVAAVAALSRVGIDVEKVAPRRRYLFDLTASEEEWEIAGGKSWPAFFRVWTAKEAALKAVGVGIGGLRACRVKAMPDDRRTLLEHDGVAYVVRHLHHSGHMVSVVAGDSEIEWTVIDQLPNGVDGAVRRKQEILTCPR